jgi:RNA polymerase sigma-70 factor (ECF subfamily)
LFSSVIELALENALGPSRANMNAAERLTRMFQAHVAFVARSLRRLGVAQAELEDATQEVFVVASRKLEQIDASTEKAFLFGTAMRIASNARRSRKRNIMSPADDLDARPNALPSADEMLERRRQRAVLDGVLDTLDDDVRAVFVLRELEGMTVPEVAALLEIPQGTVASRSRRGHAQFDEAVARLQGSKKKEET